MLKFHKMLKGFNTVATARILAVILFSCILSNTTVLGMQSPLNVAVAGAIAPLYSTAILIGSLLTYFFTGKVIEASVIICGLFITMAIRWIFEERVNSAIKSLSTVFAMLISGIAIVMATSGGLRNIFVECGIAILTGMATFFIAEALEAYKNGSFRIKGADGCAVAVVYVLSVLAFSSLGFSIINVGRIFGVFVILCAVQKYRHIGGAICGVLTTCGTMIYSNEIGLATVFLGVSGLTTGFFAEMGKVVIGFFFISINTIGLLTMGVNDSSLSMQADVIIGAIAFMTLPIQGLQNLFSNEGMSHNHKNDKLVSARLNFVANSLTSIRKNSEEISEMISRDNVKRNIAAEVCEGMCGKCSHKLYCWSDCYENTNNCFNEIIQMNTLNASNFPKKLRCIKKDELIKFFAEKFREWKIDRVTSSQLGESRKILFEQMSLTEEILSSICETISGNINYDSVLTAQVCKQLKQYYVSYNMAVCYFNDKDKFFIEIYCYRMSEEECERICEILSEILCRDLEYSKTKYSDNETRLLFAERTKYTFDIIGVQESASQYEPSGDSFEYFNDGMGNAYIILSDGMGNGREASLESKMAIGYFKRLIKTGMECESAIKLLNSIMLTKLGEEMFSTLDILKTDLNTGRSIIYKCGASITLLKRNSNLMMINGISFPIGILKDVTVFKKEIILSESDVIIMLSDGVTENTYPLIKSLMRNEEYSYEEIAETIRDTAINYSEDDISIIIANLKLREECETECECTVKQK